MPRLRPERSEMTSPRVARMSGVDADHRGEEADLEIVTSASGMADHRSR